MKRQDDITLKNNRLAAEPISKPRGLRANSPVRKRELPLRNLASCAGQQSFAVDSARGAWLIVSGDRAELRTAGARR